MIAGLVVGAIAYWAVDVRVTDSGELPTVDVEPADASASDDQPKEQ